jgi:hypothetical protein
MGILQPIEYRSTVRCLSLLEQGEPIWHVEYMNEFPLLIQFAPGSRILRESPYEPKLPIVQNGPSGTFVQLSDRRLIPLPTDQIVFADDSKGAAQVAFGGMQPAGMEGDELVFYRVKDLQPPEELSPQRGTRMTLQPEMVSAIRVAGLIVWPQ